MPFGLLAAFNVRCCAKAPVLISIASIDITSPQRLTNKSETMEQYLEQGSSFLNGQIMGITIKTFIPAVKIGTNFCEAHLKLWSENKSNYLPTHLSIRAWEGEVWDHHFHTSIHFHPILFHIRSWMAREQLFKSSKWPLIIHPPQDPTKNRKMEPSSLLHPQCNTSQLYVYMTYNLWVPVHTTKYYQKQLPGAEATAQEIWYCWGSGIFYSSD